MAEIRPTISYRNDDAIAVQWANITEADTCVAYEGFHEYSDRSVQVQGAFGGASVSIQGSNDAENYHTLNDPFGSLLSFSTGGLRQVLEYVRRVQPAISGGSGASITVTVLAKRIRR
jgi:hypothetical protein